MSFQAMTWATEQALPAMQKIVLLMMANRTNHETGLCYPSLELLAKECGMERRSVINQIVKLEAVGLLEVIRSSNDQGNKNVNRYRLNLKASAAPNVDEKSGHGSERDSLGGSERNSLGGSERDSLGSERNSLGGSERDSLGSERDSLGGSERDSLKPVTIEPVNNNNNKHEGERAKKQQIASDWQPSDRCLDLIQQAGIDQAFAKSLVGGFVLYWQEAQVKRPGWDASFLNHVKDQHQRQSSRAIAPTAYSGRSVKSSPGVSHERTSSRSAFAEKYPHLAHLDRYAQH